MLLRRRSLLRSLLGNNVKPLVNNIRYVYANGDMCESLTGGWQGKIGGHSACKISFEKDCVSMYATCNSSVTGHSFMYTKNKITIQNDEYAGACWKVTDSGGHNHIGFGLDNNAPSSTGFNFESIFRSKYGSAPYYGIYDHVTDIPSGTPFSNIYASRPVTSYLTCGDQSNTGSPHAGQSYWYAYFIYKLDSLVVPTSSNWANYLLSQSNCRNLIENYSGYGMISLLKNSSFLSALKSSKHINMFKKTHTWGPLIVALSH